MSPLALQLLRRLAVWAVVLAFLLLSVPRVLTEFGLLGPSVQGQVDAAARAIEAARTYGASEGQATLGAAVEELDRARDLAKRGEDRRARRAAEAARERAIEAQRAALATREQARRRAEVIVADVDRLLNGLEQLYGKVTPGLDKATVSRLLSRMKNARQAGASLFLAHEQGDFVSVVQDEPAARRVLLAVRDELASAKPSGRDK